MFKLNLKIALRHIWKHKLTTSIKLVGLIIGLSTVILLIVYLLFELSYDRHHVNVDQIHRIKSLDTKTQEESIYLPSGFAQMLMNELPEVINVTELLSNQVQVKIGENFFKEELIATDNAFLHIFTVPLLVGDLKNALKAPNTLIISERFAKIAFPNGDALGKSITIINYSGTYQVVGIMKNIPKASHFKADLIIANFAEKLNWKSYSSATQYLQLKKGSSSLIFEQKLKSLYKKHEIPKEMKISLMPLSKIHLYSHEAHELDANSDIRYVYIFALAAFFILLIAIVNFINLTIAEAIKRVKEIGVKKVLGASTKQLRWQFLSESYLYFIVASVVVLIITHDLIPFIGNYIGADLSFSSMLTFKTLVVAIIITSVSGFIAGIYPAIILAKLMPVKTLKGYTGHTLGKFGFKKVLMVFQFSISAFLIVATLVIYWQLNFIKNKRLGFDREQVLVSSVNKFGKAYPNFKKELVRRSDIKSISISSFNPGSSFGGGSSWTNKNDTTTYTADFIDADLDFIKTLNIHVLEGRAFSEKYSADLTDYFVASQRATSDEGYLRTISQRPIILNKAAVKRLNLANPVDIILKYDGLQGKVIGVVNDFNGMSLHQQVTPVVIQLTLDYYAGYLFIKTNSNNLASTKAEIEKLFKKHFPMLSPDFQFLDLHLEKLYQSEMRLGSIFATFATIAIILCCIGLFGMVYFDLEQRTKEIAVRKILGASVNDLLTLLNSSFIKIIIVANILVWPFAYYLIKEWLNGFYYRIELTYTPFLFALALCLLLTILTVSLQAMRTLKKSPVDALKYE